MVGGEIQEKKESETGSTGTEEKKRPRRGWGKSQGKNIQQKGGQRGERERLKEIISHVYIRQIPGRKEQ